MPEQITLGVYTFIAAIVSRHASPRHTSCHTCMLHLPVCSLTDLHVTPSPSLPPPLLLPLFDCHRCVWHAAHRCHAVFDSNVCPTTIHARPLPNNAPAFLFPAVAPHLPLAPSLRCGLRILICPDLPPAPPGMCAPDLLASNPLGLKAWFYVIEHQMLQTVWGLHAPQARTIPSPLLTHQLTFLPLSGLPPPRARPPIQASSTLSSRHVVPFLH